MRDEDIARLSPLGHEHINMLGRYAFSLPDACCSALPRRAALPPAACAKKRNTRSAGLSGFTSRGSRRTGWRHPRRK